MESVELKLYFDLTLKEAFESVFLKAQQTQLNVSFSHLATSWGQEYQPSMDWGCSVHGHCSLHHKFKWLIMRSHKLTGIEQLDSALSKKCKA